MPPIILMLDVINGHWTIALSPKDQGDSHMHGANDDFMCWGTNTCLVLEVFYFLIYICVLNIVYIFFLPPKIISITYNSILLFMKRSGIKKTLGLFNGPRIMQIEHLFCSFWILSCTELWLAEQDSEAMTSTLLPWIDLRTKRSDHLF